MTVRAEKIAAALFAIYFAYYLKSTILGYATEPKVIGGIDLDRAIPQVIPWSPIYYPMLLSAALAYWLWPTAPHRGLAKRIAAGSFAMVRIIYLTLFISILCTGFGEFYLAFPLILKAEILPMLVNVFMATLGGAAVMGIFHAMPFIFVGIVVGSAIVLGGDFASKHLPAESREPADFASLSTMLRSASEWPWFSLLAGLVTAIIIAKGFVLASLPMLFLWILFFFNFTFPCIAVGAVIGFFSRQWAWCVPVSLPVAYWFSMPQAGAPGLLASLAFDFPPILFAMVVGFLAMRALAPRIFPDRNASSRSFGS
jgi:hypothetical protein